MSIDANQTKFLKLSETLSFFVSYQTFIEYIEARIFGAFENAVHIYTVLRIKTRHLRIPIESWSE